MYVSVYVYAIEIVYNNVSHTVKKGGSVHQPEGSAPTHFTHVTHVIRLPWHEWKVSSETWILLSVELPRYGTITVVVFQMTL